MSFMEFWRSPSLRANSAWREHKRLYAQERKVHCGSQEMLSFNYSFAAIQGEYLATAWEQL